MALDKKTVCPKCGSKDISDVTSRLPLGGGSLRTTGKQWPEPMGDDPPDKYVRPMTDFNHPYHCNSCGHYFGSGFGSGI